MKRKIKPNKYSSKLEIMILFHPFKTSRKSVLLLVDGLCLSPTMKMKSKKINIHKFSSITYSRWLFVVLLLNFIVFMLNCTSYIIVLLFVFGILTGYEIGLELLTPLFWIELMFRCGLKAIFSFFYGSIISRMYSL